MEQNENQKIQNEIADLQWQLTSHASVDTGDFHPIKMMDAILRSDKFWELFGDNALPYTKEETLEFLNAREAKRQRIRELQKQLEK